MRRHYVVLFCRTRPTNNVEAEVFKDWEEAMYFEKAIVRLGGWVYGVHGCEMETEEGEE